MKSRNGKKKKKERNLQRGYRRVLRGFQLSNCAGDKDVDWNEVERVDRLVKKHGY